MSLKTTTFRWTLLTIGLLSLAGIGGLFVNHTLFASQGFQTQFDLVSESFTGVDDAAGAWLFDEGLLLSVPDGNPTGYYQQIFRAFSGKGNSPNAASIQTVLFFDDGTPGQAPSNVTLNGAHNFNSGNQRGSISAVGGTLIGLFVGSQYELDGATNRLTIFDNL